MVPPHITTPLPPSPNPLPLPLPLHPSPLGPPSVLFLSLSVVPVSKCKLRLLRLERIKDLLLLEEEFLSNQQSTKPREEKEEEEKTKVDEAQRLSHECREHRGAD